MFSKGLLAASNSHLQIKANVGERRPSLIGDLGDRRPSIIGHSGERRPSLVIPQGDRRHSSIVVLKSERRSSNASQNSECHRVMMELQQNIGRPGTTTKEIEDLMGAPSKILDQPDETLSHELKRNNGTYEYPHNAKIWIYEWRTNHDYVYFIISTDNKVIQSAWYYAFE